MQRLGRLLPGFVSRGASFMKSVTFSGRMALASKRPNPRRPNGPQEPSPGLSAAMPWETMRKTGLRPERAREEVVRTWRADRSPLAPLQGAYAFRPETQGGATLALGCVLNPLWGRCLARMIKLEACPFRAGRSFSSSPRVPLRSTRGYARRTLRGSAAEHSYSRR